MEVIASHTGFVHGQVVTVEIVRDEYGNTVVRSNSPEIGRLVHQSLTRSLTDWVRDEAIKCLPFNPS
jgi:hypothetical protein